MSNPWDIKQDDTRSSDSLYTYIIFCEDETSENFYLKWFETNLIKVNIINGQNSMFKNVTNAVSYCVTNNLMSISGNSYRIDVEGIEVWCVYDRDKQLNPANLHAENIAFNLSINTALANDIKVAWSNDAFELWILLHLFEIDIEDTNTFNRQFYYNSLTDYFKEHPNPNVDLEKALRHATFSYKKDMKHKDNFINIVREEILPHTLIAIERAKDLHDKQSHLPNYYDMCPCTLMFQLVESLLDTGKKALPVA